MAQQPTRTSVRVRACLETVVWERESGWDRADGDAKDAFSFSFDGCGTQGLWPAFHFFGLKGKNHAMYLESDPGLAFFSFESPLHEFGFHYLIQLIRLFKNELTLNNSQTREVTTITVDELLKLLFLWNLLCIGRVAVTLIFIRTKMSFLG